MNPDPRQLQAVELPVGSTARGGRGLVHEGSRPSSWEYFTPPHIFTAIGLRFDLDPASPIDGPPPWVPADRFLSIHDDGLRAPWYGRVWLNPPYGPDIGRWIDRAIDYGLDGELILLVHARTDTRWFQRAAAVADAVTFIAGRLSFPVRKDGTTRPGDDGRGRSGAGTALLAWGLGPAGALGRSGLGVTFPGERVR